MRRGDEGIDVDSEEVGDGGDGSLPQQETTRSDDVKATKGKLLKSPPKNFFVSPTGSSYNGI